MLKEKRLWYFVEHRDIQTYNVECGILGCDTVYTCRWEPMFRRSVLPPSSVMKLPKRHKMQSTVINIITVRISNLD
jgi:hypothetical protein